LRLSLFGFTDGARGHVHVHGVSVRGLRASRVTRVAARAVVGAMLFGVWPWSALASPAAPAAAEVSEEQAPPAQPRANRALPKFEAPAAMPQFSDPPTDRELFRARVFDEPLVPSGATSPEANAALGKALRSYLAESTREQVRALEEFLEDQPSSPWRVSVLANLAIVGRRTGFFSRTLEYGEKAWLEGRESTVPAVRALAARALAERAELLARLGRVDDVRALLAEVEGAEFSGSAHEKFDQVKQSLWMMENRPAESYRCGPLAVGALLRTVRGLQDERIEATPSTSRGTSLLQMKELGRKVGLEVQVGRRPSTEAPVAVPSLVHWRAGHFAALVKKEGERYLLQDPTFGDEIWISRAAVDAEADGYFLVVGKLPEGWQAVSDEEAGAIWGKGAPPGQNAETTKPEDGTRGGDCPPCRGMALYTFQDMLASLKISDHPLVYETPVGPGFTFSLTYNQRESFQPSVFTYSNVGPKWTYGYLSYVSDDPSNGAQTATVYRTGGGQETYTGYDAGTQSYAPHYQTRAVLVRTSTSPIVYERRIPGGSVEVFSQPDGAIAFPRKVLLTEIRDPQGNAVKLHYDAELRLAAVTDAVGQVTTLSYELASDWLKITKVTDPYGRTAKLEYDSNGRLSKITDTIGLVSAFTYGAGDFVTSLTTPYGTTKFETGQNGADRWIQATDPLGGQERLEYVNGHAPDKHPATDAVVPTGFSPFNTRLDTAMTFFWGKRQMALAPGDYTRAVVTHFAWMPGTSQASSIKRAEKQPLENRVWYRLPGQSGPRLGGATQPIEVARVLDDGSTQKWQYEYDDAGNRTRAIDPVGRETVYEYAANQIDLLSVKQKNGASWDTLSTTTYDSNHRPLTTTDAAGQTTTYTYDARGRVLTVVTPSRSWYPSGMGGSPQALTAAERTTTYEYNADTVALGPARLKKVTGPSLRDSQNNLITGPVTQYAYDGPGRVASVTDVDGHMTTYTYDAMDRVTRVSFPDGTWEQTEYERLDPVRQRDRLGRWSESGRDALRRQVWQRDAAGRMVSQTWCVCGSLESLIDAKGQQTKWEHDVQGRVVKEIRPDGATWSYEYEQTTSRLKKVTDAKGQIKTYAYAGDDRLLGIGYTNETNATPDVSFAYDSVYPRLSQMVDGTGTTAYGYYPVTTSLGSGMLQTVNGPLTDDTITYFYDELGRVSRRDVNGSANTVLYGYDALGRMNAQGNLLGQFQFGYDGPTSRLLKVTYPNGQVSDYTYEPNAGDHRLKQIHHKKPDTSTLAKFDYTTDAGGRILTWRQQQESNPAKEYTFGYDRVDQLTAATLRDVTSGDVVKTYAYAYDPAGNRTLEAIDLSATTASFNNRNQLVSQAVGGAMVFQGTTSEPATVTVGGVPAQTTAAGAFTAAKPVTGSQQTIQVVATDGSGNTRTNTYQFTPTGTNATYGYDANGNMTTRTEGGVTTEYVWDAENRLIEVKQGGNALASFTYDGEGRRYSATSGGATRVFINDGRNVAEQRDATDPTKTFFGMIVDHYLGSIDSMGVKSFGVADHLMSVSAITDANGSALVARAYDPYGRLLMGAGSDGYAYTGREWEPEANLYYYRARFSAPDMGRFISEDPSGTLSGPNFYAYVENDPINYSDPLGLLKAKNGTPAPTGDLLVKLKCLEGCIGREFELRLTATTNGEHKGPEHPDGLAADFTIVPRDPFWDPNPRYHSETPSGNDVLCCALGCDFQYSIWHGKSGGLVTATHFHVQIPPWDGKRAKPEPSECTCPVP
jgi:RHS repeat-associated protein